MRERKISQKTDKFLQKLCEEQDGRCYWCGRKFGTLYSKHYNVFLPLQATFDHIIPHIYSKDHTEKNLVASCNICNGIKYDKIFKSEEECKDYLFDRWQKKIRTHKIIIFDEYYYEK